VNVFEKAILLKKVQGTDFVRKFMLQKMAALNVNTLQYIGKLRNKNAQYWPINVKLPYLDTIF
jgi:hypothetical protein